MKHIEAAWIEQILTFDSPAETDLYLAELDRRKMSYAVIEREPQRLRIRKQYNQNTLLRKG